MGKKGTDPERGQKLALALAMIQGPKAVIQLAVSTAIGQTELGQDLNEQYDRATTRVGTMLAEHMEGGGVVLNGESDSDKFLVGGGKLISSMILGVASGRKGSGGHEAKKPTTTPVELPGGGKGVKDGTKGGGAAGQKLPSALPENLTGYANPKDIRFTQDSVSNNSKDGKTLQSTIDGLKSGKISPDDLPPIRVFEKDGVVYSLDNRRLLAASEAGVPIKIVPATPAQVAKEGWKMTTPNNGSIICVRGICK